MTITTWGTGRKDYSQNVEASVVPVTRSHQYRTFGSNTIDYTPYDWVTIDLESVLGDLVLLYDLDTKYNYDIYYGSVEYPSNVLIKAYIGTIDYDTNRPTYGQVIAVNAKFGYGKVDLYIPKGYHVTKEQLQDNYYPCMAFLPGGYIVKNTMGFIKEQMA